MIPFGLVLGVAVNASSMPTAIAWSTSPLIFAGAAQLATVSLAASSAWLALVATASVINLRHVMYSAAIAPRFADQPRWFRIVGPYLLVDQVFALVTDDGTRTGDAFRRHYLAVGLFFFTGWNLAVVAGMLAGEAIPGTWRLDAAPAVMFCGIVVIGLAHRSAAAAAGTSVVVAVVALPLPNNLGLLLAATAGVIAGYLTDSPPTPPAPAGPPSADAPDDASMAGG